MNLKSIHRHIKRYFWCNTLIEPENRKTTFYKEAFSPSNRSTIIKNCVTSDTKCKSNA